MSMSAEFGSVAIASVNLNREGRIRKKLDPKHLEEMADSISRLGLIHPIVIDRDNTLRAGENRLEACRALGWTSIPFQYTDALSEKGLLSIEMEENFKRKDLDWKDKCDALLRFHNLQVADDPTWSTEATASAIGYSQVEVQQQLAVAREAAKGNARVLAAPKISVAKGIVRRETERKRSDALSAIGLLESTDDNGVLPEVPPSPIQVADFLTWAPEYRGIPFNFIHCDFPYGINADQFNQAGASAFGGYKDTFEHYDNLLETLIGCRQNLMGESAHLLFWFSMKHYAFTLEKLSKVFWVDPYPLIWHKSDNKGTLPDPERGPRRVYEVAFLCSHGDRKILSPVSNTFSGPTIRTEASHMSEKSEDMLAHFFRMICDGGTRMLDPTAGSASALRAARRLGVSSMLGLEVNPEYAANAQRAFEAQLLPS